MEQAQVQRAKTVVGIQADIRLIQKGLEQKIETTRKMIAQISGELDLIDMNAHVNGIRMDYLSPTFEGGWDLEDYTAKLVRLLSDIAYDQSLAKHYEAYIARITPSNAVGNDA